MCVCACTSSSCSHYLFLLYSALVLPTAPAHADVLYHMAPVGLSFCHSLSSYSASLLYLTLILFLCGLGRSFVGPSAVPCLLHRSFSLLFFLSQHFTVHEHHTFPSLVLFYASTFFFRVVIVWPLSLRGLFMSILFFPV